MQANNNRRRGGRLLELSRRKFTREPASQRREDLIRATLSLIGKSGVRSATVRSIADEAGVTLGLIRHYFSSKDDLINAAYQFHMSAMTQMTMSSGKSAPYVNGAMGVLILATAVFILLG